MVSVIALVAPPRTSASPVPILVEVWCSGDDALTIRFRDAVENAFRQASDFQLSAGQKPATLFVTIAKNVGWIQVGKRIKVLYIVQFSSAEDHSLGTSSGSCWDYTLAKCASRIVHNAKTAARRRTPPHLVGSNVGIFPFI